MRHASKQYARYDAFGGYRTKPNHTVNPGISDRGYTGHKMNNTGLDDLGLIYMNARYYVPEVGRFASPDTIVPDPGNPQSFNRYSYTNNNPVNFTDPTGHCIVAYSGDVRMGEGPYGTSGLCPNTESVITEGTAAIDAIHNDPDFATPTEDLLLYYIGGPIVILGAPVLIEALPLIIPALGSGGTAACADGDCTNELSYFARAAEYGIRSTKELRSLIKGTGLQAHHIIEQRFTSTIGAKTQEMLSA